MRNRMGFILLAGVLVFAAACSSAKRTESTETIVGGLQNTRPIYLTTGDTITTDGDKLTVTIEEGKRNDGTYTSTSKVLLNDARAARDALGKPGTTVWIRVDTNRRIAAIGWKRES